MAILHFTRQLGRFVEAAPVETGASELRGALEAAFSRHPQLRSYVLDDQGRLRRHVVVFIDGLRCRDRIGLGDLLRADSQVYILQALSGG